MTKPTSEKSASVLHRDILIAPFPLSFTDLAQDEKDDGEGSTQQCHNHQKLEAEDQALH